MQKIDTNLTPEVTYEFALEQVPGNPVCAKRIMRRKVPTF
jgi:hypothetical protein